MRFAQLSTEPLDGRNNTTAAVDDARPVAVFKNVMNLSARCVALLLVAAVFSIPEANGQDLTGYEKLLLPVFSTEGVSGANGSTFGTSLSCYTEVDTSYYAGRPIGSNAPPGFMTLPAFIPTFAPLNYGPPGPSGRFLFVEKTKLPDLSLQYLLASTSSDGKYHVTALPIIRTPLTATARILGIPVDPILEYPNGQPAGVMRGYDHRNTLRVYDFEGGGSGQVTVERFVAGLFGRQGSFGKIVLNLDQRYGEDPTFPYFGQLDLNRCVPFSSHTPCSTFYMRVEIVPITPGLHYWGFVSSTNNSTAEVTIFAPQPPLN